MMLFASCVEKIEAPAWLAHDAQKRKPSSASPGGLNASSLTM